ncbi:MAG: DNA polymerase III subunit beta [Oscillospiraceae bacterium]|nr:DNA polymerase III subunit beta [Oscillospiraceae bacterium]
MRFTCEKSMLVTALNITGRAVAPKSAITALEGIYCDASTDLTFTGYNMETAVIYRVDAEILDAGKCVFPARLFGDIIRRLPEGPVTVAVDENYKVSVRAGYSAFTISAEPAEDYPSLPDVGSGRNVSLPQSALKELIGSTIFAVSENQGRPIHTGVKFEVETDKVSAIAVDGFRLARRTFPADAGTEISFVVPAQGLKEVEKILVDNDDEVSFTLDSKHILFSLGDATLICRLLEGDFLDWRKVVPTNSPIKLTANVADLSSAIERVGLIVSEKYKSPVRCVFSEQVLQLRTNTTIGAAEDRCAIAGDGKDLEIGFNVRYLADALRVIPSEEVVLELTNSLSPIVFTSAEEKYDFSYMVLPVRIKS